jgi:hypothetical protein
MRPEVGTFCWATRYCLVGRRVQHGLVVAVLPDRCARLQPELLLVEASRGLDVVDAKP